MKKNPKTKHYLLKYSVRISQIDDIYAYFANFLKCKDLSVLLIGYQNSATLVYLKTNGHYRKASFKGRFIFENNDPIFIPNCYNEDGFKRMCEVVAFKFRKDEQEKLMQEREDKENHQRLLTKMDKLEGTFIDEIEVQESQENQRPNNFVTRRGTSNSKSTILSH